MIEQGYEHQARELADAATTVGSRYGDMGSNGARRAAYCQGVRDVLRLLVGDLATTPDDTGRPTVTAELAAILNAADVTAHEPSDPLPTSVEVGQYVRISNQHPTYPLLRGMQARVVSRESSDNQRPLYIVEVSATGDQVAVFGDEITAEYRRH